MPLWATLGRGGLGHLGAGHLGRTVAGPIWGGGEVGPAALSYPAYTAIFLMRSLPPFPAEFRYLANSSLSFDILLNDAVVAVACKQ